MLPLGSTKCYLEFEVLLGQGMIFKYGVPQSCSKKLFDTFFSTSLKRPESTSSATFLLAVLPAARGFGA